MQYSVAGALLLGFFLQVISAAPTLSRATSSNIRAIYLFKDVLKSNTSALMTSGFNSLIIFGVGILANGDIMYYSNTAGTSDVLVASGGSYVGGDALAAKVKSFKTAAGTGIDRVEISMNSQNVKSLMASPGPVATSPLYKNFAALKAAWGLDAVNNDDESIYDAASTVTFAKMLSAIGYHYTLAPYTNNNYWAGVVKQLGGGTASGVLDRVYLQCYDGGALNNPASWASVLGMKVVPLLWVTNDSKPSEGSTVAQAKSRFAGWTSRSASSLAGGGYWNDYDIEKMKLSYTAYGNVLNEQFP